MWRRRLTSKRDYFLNRFPLEDPDIFRSAEIAPVECNAGGEVCNLRLIARAFFPDRDADRASTTRRPFMASKVAQTSRIPPPHQAGDTIRTLLIISTDIPSDADVANEKGSLGRMTKCKEINVA